MKLLRYLATFAMILSLLVVMLGAYTRLTHAGLGCPDWPGCYGRLSILSLQVDPSHAQTRFPDIPIETRKAWTEMLHRYAAGVLVLLIVTLNIGIFRENQKNQSISQRIPLILVFLIGFQAMLGMWTVTLKLLPLVVMGHLLGGILIFSFLCYFRMQLNQVRRIDNSQLRWLVLIGLIAIFCQITLGGWVSSNYAGLACVGFPRCNGSWLPTLDFAKGFDVFLPIGANYQGGVFDSTARVTIQFVHRVGAMLVGSYVLALSVWLWRSIRFAPLRLTAFAAAFFMVLQLTLGIFNVIYLLPLDVAVMHNGVAAVLLALFFVMHYLVSGGARNESSF